MLHCNCKENLVFDPFLQLKPPNLQHLMMDATLLLPITGTPLTGIEFYKRLPCGEVEHTRRVRQTHITRTLFCYFAQVVKQENNLFRLGHLVLLEFRKNSDQLEQSTVVRTRMQTAAVTCSVVINQLRSLNVRPNFLSGHSLEIIAFLGPICIQVMQNNCYSQTKSSVPPKILLMN